MTNKIILIVIIIILATTLAIWLRSSNTQGESVLPALPGQEVPTQVPINTKPGG